MKKFSAIEYQGETVFNIRFFVEVRKYDSPVLEYQKIAVDFAPSKNMYRISGKKNTWHSLTALQGRLDNSQVVSKAELLLENRIKREGWDMDDKIFWSVYL